MSDPYASKSGLKKVKVPVAGDPNDRLKTMVAPPIQQAPRLSDETLAGLNALADAMDSQSTKEEDQKEQVAEAPEEEDSYDDDNESADGRFDLGELPDKYKSVIYSGTPWDNKEARTKIEKKCSDINFSDLILLGRVKQVVPIKPGTLEVEFQSLSSQDSLWITQASNHIADPFEAQVWAGYARLVASVTRMQVGGVRKDYHNHLSKDGTISKKDFDKKYDQVMKMSDRVLQILLINLTWFEDRISRLFVDDFDQLKNG